MGNRNPGSTKGKYHQKLAVWYKTITSKVGRTEEWSLMTDFTREMAFYGDYEWLGKGAGAVEEAKRRFAEEQEYEIRPYSIAKV